jgi:hypothetical protein
VSRQKHTCVMMEMGPVTVDNMRGGPAGPGARRCLKGDREFWSLKVQSTSRCRSGLTFWFQPKIQLADDRNRWHRKKQAIEGERLAGKPPRAVTEHLVDNLKCSRKVQ